MSSRALLLGALTFFGLASAEAAEYRLQVINLNEEAFAYYMESGKGSPNGSWARLESAADKGKVPWGTIIADRFVKLADPVLVRHFEAVPIKPESVEAEGRNWVEFRWQGEPGKRVLWVVEARGFSPLHEVRYVGLKGTGSPGYSIPLNAPFSPVRLKAVAFPTQFILLWNGGSLWEKWVSRYLDLGEGVGAVVGVDTNPTLPDKVFLVIEQPAGPKVFKVALAWRKRPDAHFPQYEGNDGGRIR